MHALATLSAITLSATTAHTATLPANFAVSTLAKRKNGCYGVADEDTLPEKYFNFEDLHGYRKVDNAEVSLDITHTCDLAKGYVLKPGEQSTYCSNWAASTGSGDCEQDCISSCSGSNTFPGSTAPADLASTCVDDLNWELGGCKAGSEQTWNGIWYKIDPNLGGCSA